MLLGKLFGKRTRQQNLGLDLGSHRCECAHCAPQSSKSYTLILSSNSFFQVLIPLLMQRSLHFQDTPFCPFLISFFFFILSDPFSLFPPHVGNLFLFQFYIPFFFHTVVPLLFYGLRFMCFTLCTSLYLFFFFKEYVLGSYILSIITPIASIASIVTITVLFLQTTISSCVMRQLVNTGRLLL